MAVGRQTRESGGRPSAFQRNLARLRQDAAVEPRHAERTKRAADVEGRQRGRRHLGGAMVAERADRDVRQEGECRVAVLRQDARIEPSMQGAHALGPDRSSSLTSFVFPFAETAAEDAFSHMKAVARETPPIEFRLGQAVAARDPLAPGQCGR